MDMDMDMDMDIVKRSIRRNVSEAAGSVAVSSSSSADRLGAGRPSLRAVTEVCSRVRFPLCVDHWVQQYIM
eukprot:4357826-Prymnesium_polylepis.1